MKSLKEAAQILLTAIAGGVGCALGVILGAWVWVQILKIISAAGCI